MTAEGERRLEPGQDGGVERDGTFGPNTARIERLFARAGELTEQEAQDLLAAQRRLLRNRRISGPLYAVVSAAQTSKRGAWLYAAELAGRRSVAVLPGTRRAVAVAGIVGRMAEALVVADLVEPEALAELFEPWRRTIGDV